MAAKAPKSAKAAARTALPDRLLLGAVALAVAVAFAFAVAV